MRDPVRALVVSARKAAQGCKKGLVAATISHRMATGSVPPQTRQRALYDEAVGEFGNALSRLIRSYERDGDKRDDLRQEIHFALWRSFARFD